MDTLAMKNPLEVELFELPIDMKRMLRIQWKEFIHHIDDANAYQISQLGERTAA